MDFKPITQEQTNSNITRAIKEGLISLLSDKEINKLSLKYYGIKGDNGDYIAFVDPYSGVIIRDEKQIALDHILPVCLDGGTVLFNCIPVKTDVNTSKNGSYLLEWWKKQEYYSEDKLEKLIEYMLEAYEITFDETNVDKLFMANSNEDYEEIERHLVEEAPLDKTQKELQEERENNKIKHSYKELMENLISEVKEENKKKSYEERLENLSNKNIFEEIQEYIYIINIFKDIIVEYLKSIDEYSDYHEETILTKCNFKKLHKNLKKNYPKEKWEEEITRRIKIIEGYLNEDNLTLSSYYENLDKDKHLIQSEEITKEEYNKFKSKIKLSKYDKFRLIIQFVNNTRRLPKHVNPEEDQLVEFIRNIKRTLKNRNGFRTKISTRELITLATSEYECLRNIYEEIEETYKDNNMNISDYEIAFKKIDEMKQNGNIPDPVYYDKSPIVQTLLQFVQDTGRLPKHGILEEDQLASFKRNIKGIASNRNSIKTKISTRDLITLATSEYECLRNIYEEIEETYNQNNMDIRDYDIAFKKIDEMKQNGNLPDPVYYEQIKDNPKVQELLLFVNDEGRLPKNGILEENQLATFIQSIKGKYSNRNSIKTKISTRDLITLATSEYECLRNIYEEIEETYNQNNMDIRDYDIAFKKIDEMRRNGNIPDPVYYEQIEDNLKVQELIQFVNNERRLPKNGILEENQLAKHITRIKEKDSNRNSFATKISTRDLITLATSEYECLRNIYEEIEETYNQNNMDIRDYDIAFKKIDEMRRNGNIPDPVYYEQIEDNLKVQELMQFVNDEGRLPKQGTPAEDQLANFIQSIKGKSSKRNGFKTRISTRDLIVLATSKYECLRNVYEKIKETYKQNNMNIRDYEEAFMYIDSLEKGKGKAV